MTHIRRKSARRHWHGKMEISPISLIVETKKELSKMNKKVVAVLFGGRSPEHDVSKESAANVIANMPDEKYLVLPIYITKEGRWLLYEGAVENIKAVNFEKFGSSVVLSPDTEHKGLLRIVHGKVKIIHIDIAFPVLHGLNGEDGTIQGLLELANIPYVGCGVLSSANALDKVYTKIIAERIGLAQSEYLVFTESELEDMAAITKKIRYKLGYPVFVKPSNSGSSLGISKASSKKELEEALILATQHDRKIVVEKAIKGREFECALLGDYNNPEASSVGEVLPASDFYDFDTKYNNPDSKTVIPADIPEEISEEIRKKAVEVFKAMDCYGLSRADFFLEDETNKIIFNEINTCPGFTSISLYPELWHSMGIKLDSLIDKLIDLGLER